MIDNGSKTRLDQFERVTLTVTIAVGLAVWGLGIRRCGYDYDEVLHAHSVWLDAQGRRPYRDFMECHPPYFSLLSPLIRRVTDPSEILQVLRWAGAAGNLLFLVGLAALGGSRERKVDRWTILGLTMVACHPEILTFLVEFRVDGFGSALAVLALVRFLRLPRRSYRHSEFGLTTGFATFLCPKLALLPPLVVVTELVFERAPFRTFVQSLAAYLAALLLAAGIIEFALTMKGVSLNETYDLVYRYNSIHNANSGFQHGLFNRLLELRSLSALILAGWIAWIVHTYRQHSKPAPYEAALFIWLLVQAIIVTYPNKQYYGPWCLFASGYLAYLGRDLREPLGGVQPGRFLCRMRGLGRFGDQHGRGLVERGRDSFTR